VPDFNHDDLLIITNAMTDSTPRSWPHVRIHTHAWTNMRAHKHAHTHTQMHATTHMHTRMSERTHILTRTQHTQRHACTRVGGQEVKVVKPTEVFDKHKRQEPSFGPPRPPPRPGPSDPPEAPSTSSAVASTVLVPPRSSDAGASQATECDMRHHLNGLAFCPGHVSECAGVLAKPILCPSQLAHVSP